MATTKAPSLATQVRDWVNALPEGTPFRTRDVPVRQEAANVTLSRLAAEPAVSGVQRFLRGAFLKGRRVRDIQNDSDAEPASVWSFGPNNDYMLLAWYLAGEPRGLGYSRLHALHQVGWTDQVPINTDLVVVGKPPQSPRPGFVNIFSRWNERRRDLSPAEVTVIEAARFSWFLNDEDLLPYLRRSTRDTPDRPVGGLATSLFVQDYVLRPDKLRWAVETENCKNADIVRDRVNWFADMLPGELRYQRHWAKGHLLDA